MRPVIIVFAKAPVPGRVKTRLRLDPWVAAELHRSFVLDTLCAAKEQAAVVELHTDTGTTAWPEAGVPRRLQHEGDLGLKMLKALEAALDRGHPRVLILGSDSPDLPAAFIAELLDARADIALGPAEDGGYYGISAARVHAEMFSGVRWSGPHALEDTLAACARRGLSTSLGSPWYDIDDPPSLERLARSPAIPRHTRAALQALSQSGVFGSGLRTA